nr:MAG TPA: hypothetical protein [Caudoviricetes sp.]
MRLQEGNLGSVTRSGCERHSRVAVGCGGAGGYSLGCLVFVFLLVVISSS